VVLGLVAFCAFLLDGAAANWISVHVRGEREAGPALAAAAFTAFALALALGRLGGDRAVARFGRARVIRAGGAAAALGSALAILAPTTGPAIAGWACFGLGLSAVAPVVLGASPDASDAPAPVAIAIVSTIGYLGSFTGAPLVGALAEVGGLSAALGLLVVMSLLMAFLASAGAGRPVRHPAAGPDLVTREVTYLIPSERTDPHRKAFR
jgi:MFS family permease